MTNDPHGEYEFRVRTYECGPDGVASLPTLCNYLQEAASIHAESLKFSKSNFDAEHLNISWVLTRMRVQVKRYPKWEDTVKVLTFPRSVRKIVAYRDFVLTLPDGSPLAVATSEWMMIDLAKRRAVAIPSIVSENLNIVRTPVLGETPFAPKLRYPDPVPAGESRKTFTATRSCIDLNGHVNNVRYLEWMLEAAPEPKDGDRVTDLEVVFRSETFVGDPVVARCVSADGAFFHRVSAPDGKDHIVARTLRG